MKIKNLTKSEFKNYISEIKTIVLPVGAVEPHGDHLPLGTDIFIPEGLVNKFEEKIGDKIMIAPPVNYGHVWTMKPYPGAVNISTSILVEYLNEIGNSFLDNGIKNIVMLNGHGGNVSAINTAAEKLADQGARVIIFSWWQDFKEEILEICDTQGHAGEDESSAVLAVAEDYCHMELAKVNNNKLIATIKEKNIGKISYKNALSGDPRQASKEKGEKLLKKISNKMIEIITKFEDGDIRK